MSPAEREALIERVARARRERDPWSRLKPEPAFFDLDAEGREAAYRAALESRALEAAFDSEGLSSTGREVLRRITSR
jgi:hypothetical protein